MHGLAAPFIVISRFLEYFYKRLFDKSYFLYAGNKYQYFYHLYNVTFRNERCVELPIVQHFIENSASKEILEVGNVMNNYFEFEHDVVDKYDSGKGIISEDIVNFNPNKKYDVIVSISTLEHVGWDELPKEESKVMKAIEHLKGLLKNDGVMIVTMPLGYNHYFDKTIMTNIAGFTKMHFMQRISRDNKWQEIKISDINSIQYGTPFPFANGLIIGCYEK